MGAHSRPLHSASCHAAPCRQHASRELLCTHGCDFTYMRACSPKRGHGLLRLQLHGMPGGIKRQELDWRADCRLMPGLCHPLPARPSRMPGGVLFLCGLHKPRGQFGLPWLHCTATCTAGETRQLIEAMSSVMHMYKSGSELDWGQNYWACLQHSGQQISVVVFLPGGAECLEMLFHEDCAELCLCSICASVVSSNVIIVHGFILKLQCTDLQCSVAGRVLFMCGNGGSFDLLLDSRNKPSDHATVASKPSTAAI
eukprot:365313-Chlamydomonas_euryale.AAC.8